MSSASILVNVLLAEDMAGVAQQSDSDQLFFFT